MGVATEIAGLLFTVGHLLSPCFLSERVRLSCAMGNDLGRFAPLTREGVREMFGPPKSVSKYKRKEKFGEAIFDSIDLTGKGGRHLAYFLGRGMGGLTIAAPTNIRDYYGLVK